MASEQSSGPLEPAQATGSASDKEPFWGFVVVSSDDNVSPVAKYNCWKDKEKWSYSSYSRLISFTVVIAHNSQARAIGFCRTLKLKNFTGQLRDFYLI